MEIKMESSNKGAELLSVKVNGVERIHQGARVLDNSGEVYWRRHSSVFFPIVGAFKDNKYTINKKEYTMPKHGFARDMEFEVLEKNDMYHSYILKNNAETKRMFPYKFELYVTYLINNDTLMIKYRVVNKDKKEIAFGLGGQPAFICNVPSNSFYVEFENEEENINILRAQKGMSVEVSPVINENIIQDNKYILLNNETFEFDRIILQDISSKKIYLKSREKEKEILKLRFNNFPHFSIWSKPNSPFVAFAPFHNIPDKKESETDLFKKENLIKLKPKEEFECSYYVTFN